MGAVKVSVTDRDFCLVMPKELMAKLELDPSADYELVKARKGLWVLVAEEKPFASQNPVDAGIYSKLQEKDLPDRVEKRFEKCLSREELKRFNELLKEGKIIAFRLSPKYSRYVYKTREEMERNIKVGKKGKKREDAMENAESTLQAAFVKKDSGQFNATEKNPNECSLEKDGFTVCSNAVEAKILSERLRQDIEEGKIRGLKGFDGFFYVVQDRLYQKHRQKVLSLVNAEKGIGSEKIAEKAGIGKLLARIVCEFLKEEGEIIEKRKEQFQAV